MEKDRKKGIIIRMSKKEFIIKFTIAFFVIFFSFIYLINIYAVTDKSPILVNKFKRAFEKIQEYLILIATPAAGVAICTGLLMRKFSFGDEERVRTAKKNLIVVVKSDYYKNLKLPTKSIRSRSRWSPYH